MSQQSLFGPDVIRPYREPEFKASRVMLESGDVHWCSPDRILNPVREFDKIGFDPFSNPYSIVGAAVSYALPGTTNHEEHDLPPGMVWGDSLEIHWPLDVLIYVNPTFGKAIEACIEKIAEQVKRGCEIITCVPARIDTAWFQRGLRPHRWCALTGRVKFLELVEALEARYKIRLDKRIASGQKPPPRPDFKRVGPYLAEGAPAPFPVAMTYHGGRKDRFKSIFDRHGLVLQEA